MSSTPDNSDSDIPPASRRLKDPRHCREYAEEARVKAEQMTDPQAKASMLEVAKFDDHLAELVAQARRH